MDYEESDKDALRKHGDGIGEAARAQNTEELTDKTRIVPAPHIPVLNGLGMEIPQPPDQSYKPESDALMERLESDDSKKARLAKKWITLCKVVELSAECDPVDVLTKVYNRGISDTNDAVHRELEKQNFWRKQQG